MVDVEAAIGWVIAKGDAVDRARLSYLRSGVTPPADVLALAEAGQTTDGGWPAIWAGDVASIDATCFRLAELDDLGALRGPAARAALRWLNARQRPDGLWDEDASLANAAPPWAKPGEIESRLYLATNAGFWLAIGGAAPSGDLDGSGAPTPGAAIVAPRMRPEDTYAEAVSRASTAFRAALAPDGTWPGFLVTGWLGAALLHYTGWYYETAQMQSLLGDRIPDMSAADLAWLAASLRRAGVDNNDRLLTTARRRISALQRPDGGWASDDGERFDTHTVLTVLRAIL
jgi:hypothetical protein